MSTQHWENMEGYTFRKEKDIKPGLQKEVYETDERWQGCWKLATNVERLLICSLNKTTKRLDLILWNIDQKLGIC